LHGLQFADTGVVPDVLGEAESDALVAAELVAGTEGFLL
jgi:hypothetical protein